MTILTTLTDMQGAVMKSAKMEDKVIHIDVSDLLPLLGVSRIKE
jgi:hypothetical protein